LVFNHIQILEKNHPDITFSVDIDNTILLANKEALSRVIENLLTNGVKYNTKNGSVSVVYDSNKSNLHIIDTGIGIKNKKRVFERFYKEQERGIGIGLHIVKKLCEEMGIKITLKSEQGVGSTFTLDLSKLTLN